MFYIKHPHKTIAPGLAGIDVATKKGGMTTYWVELLIHTDSPPVELMAQILSVGFSQEPAATGYEIEHAGKALRLANIFYHKTGTGHDFSPTRCHLPKN